MSDFSHTPPAPRAGLLLVSVFLSVHCSSPVAEDPLEARTELVIITRNAPTTYYKDRDGHWTGFEHDLATSFARALNLKARFLVLDSIDEILLAVEHGRGDFAAAGLTRTESRAQQFITGPTYQTVEELVVCHPSAGVRQLPDLVDKQLHVAAATSHEERLMRLRETLPALSWTTSAEASPELILQQVGEGAFDCTVADSNALAIERRHLPQVRTPFSLGREEPLVWLIARQSAFLEEHMETWLETFRRRGRLQALLDRYYGHIAEFDYHDSSTFLRRATQRLPSYRSLFEQAARESSLPWTLLAALAYQESHWRPDATSPTGVRGMMMLTKRTARSLGVTDRLDPQQSISGGARYLAQLVKRIPPYIPDPDRLWMALAAYNVGLAHLQDARVLAVELRRDPNAWPGVKACLPRLSQKRHYLELRHGYARGHEAAAFVEQIRNYYDLLRQSAVAVD